jgi:hypothetical protein
VGVSDRYDDDPIFKTSIDDLKWELVQQEAPATGCIDRPEFGRVLNLLN